MLSPEMFSKDNFDYIVSGVEDAIENVKKKLLSPKDHPAFYVLIDFSVSRLKAEWKFFEEMGNGLLNNDSSNAETVKSTMEKLQQEYVKILEEACRETNEGLRKKANNEGVINMLPSYETLFDDTPVSGLYLINIKKSIEQNNNVISTN